LEALITWWLKTTKSARKAPFTRNPRTPAHNPAAGITLKINNFGYSWNQGVVWHSFCIISQRQFLIGFADF
jgi:hypothetical protein